MPEGLPEKAFQFRDMAKDFTSREGDLVHAVAGVSFSADAGRITCIVGPTGSGKSTLLRIAAGLEHADKGAVTVAGRDPAEMTGHVGYLSQRHTLFPWLTLKENIGLPLSIRQKSSAVIDEHVGRICGLLGLKEAKNRYPYEVSGGMQQRAAIGRLLASEALYWLMDEPFSALDDRTLHTLQRLLLDVARKNNISVLFVTHSIDEAVFIADRIIVLSAGPGRVIESFDIDLEHPRDRLSESFGRHIEQVRRQIEKVLTEAEYQA